MVVGSQDNYLSPNEAQLCVDGSLHVANCGWWYHWLVLFRTWNRFLEGEAGEAVRVSCCNMLIKLGMGELFFQQDGTTIHITHEYCIISHKDVDWHPRSCDLTPLGCFLWGYLKSKVYANNPATIPDFKHNIQTQIEAYSYFKNSAIILTFGWLPSCINHWLKKKNVCLI